jgi:hypothetical protein
LGLSWLFWPFWPFQQKVISLSDTLTKEFSTDFLAFLGFLGFVGLYVLLGPLLKS